MYSREIQKILDTERIAVGDMLAVEKNGTTYSGFLMPKPSNGDDKTILIKLGSGYNVGFDAAGLKISKIRGKPASDAKKYEKYEFGLMKKEPLKASLDAKKPKVALISTGGTISSRIDYNTGGVYAVENPEQLLHNVPELSGIANIGMSVPMKKMSEDMDPEDWQHIAREVAKELNAGAKGAIVTHGTDTLHYTSAALSFFLQNLHKPVVLVGSQRSSDRGSSDAGMNLICAAHAAVSHIAGVGTCMHGSTNDDYCHFIRGTKVRKMHTTRRDAFQPINELPIARIFQSGKIDVLNKSFIARDDMKKVELDDRLERDVALLKVYPGSDPKVIDFHVRNGIKGFVVEGTGLGNVPTEISKRPWVTAIKKHSESGIPFVITSQTVYGRISSFVYATTRKLFMDCKAISGEDMTSETAYVKLMWVLAKTKSFEKIREMMLTNYVGEITARSEANAFSPEGLNG